MKSRTSPGQQKQQSTSDRPVGIMSRSLGSHPRSQKRWQSRQNRMGKAAPQKPIDTGLSQTERETLLRKQALVAAQQGAHEQAILLFTELLRLNPLSARDYNNRGLVYFQNRQYDLAIADYDRALDLNPNLDSAYNNRGNYYAAMGLFLEAILDYDVALDLNPTNTRAWINQGITFRELHMYERAIESLDCALSLGRLSSHVYAERGRTYHLWGDWNCAIADYRNAQAYLATPQSTSPGASDRLQTQLETWMNELLSPIQ